jgi:hypothetical protein
MTTKICTKCNRILDTKNFNKGSGTTKFRSQCKSCSKKQCKQYYQNNKEGYFRRTKKYKDSVKKFLDSKKSVPCFDCGETYPSFVMDFDHLSDKTFNISHAAAAGYSLKRIKEEVNKCQVVCSNCHRERTFG